MKFLRPILVMSITSFTLCFSQTNFSNNSEDLKKIYLVSDDTTLIPEIDSIGFSENTVTDNPEFNELLNEFNVTTFNRPFYFSKTTQLQNTYELTCNCNPSTLIQSIDSLNLAIELMEIVPEVAVFYTPNDYHYSTSFCSGTAVYDNWHLDKIKAEQAWDITKGDSSIQIAVVDNGVPSYSSAFTNSDGSSQIAYSNLISVGAFHATFVSSLAAAATDNGNLFSSIGFKSRLMSYGGLNYANALHASQNGAKVINMSWGGMGSSGTQQLVIDEIVLQNNTTVIAAAGNGTSSGPNATQYYYPASYNHVISVSSTGPNDEHNYEGINKSTCNLMYLLHQYNNKVDLCAPGYNVLGMGCCNVGEPSSGTSMAAPIVSGLAALLYSINPNFTPWDIECILKKTAANIDTLSYNLAYAGGLGAGRIDAHEATILALNYEATSVIPSIAHLCNNVTSGSIQLEVSGEGPFTFEWSNGATTQNVNNLSAGNYTVTIYNSFGCVASVKKFTIESFFIETNVSYSNPCHSDEGEIYVIPFGGTEPYTFTWNNGSTSPYMNNLFEGDYSLFIEDGNGCSLQVNQTLTNQLLEQEIDYPDGLIITSNLQPITDVNQDGVIRIRGVLEIVNGVQYTINNLTLEFARDLLPVMPDQGKTHSGIIINRNAKLTANNSTFKSISFCESMWDGIQVWGDDFSRSSKDKPLNLSQLKNGEFITYNCTIQDAFIGVALYRVNIPLSGTQSNYGRGKIIANNSNFVNNRIGISFKGTSIVENSSTIINCDFICNQNLGHPYKYNGEGTETFISLLKVKNPTILGNDFIGSIQFDISKRGTAIKSYDASYIVESVNISNTYPPAPSKPNTFNVLSKGIDAYTIGGAISTIKIKDNRFNNVYQGITTNGNNFDEISFNSFNTASGDVNYNSWGIFMETCSGFLVTENNFNTETTNTHTFGIIVKNVNLIKGKIYKNVFNGAFQSATQVEGISNNLLQIDCNKYLGNNNYDWTILSDSMVDQGECSTNDIEASVSNLFGECQLFDESQILSLTEFNYYANSSFIPSCYSDDVIIYDCSSSTPFETACPQIVTDPCPTCSSNIYSQIQNSPPGFQRNKLKGEYVRSLAQAGNIQDLISFLTSESYVEDLKIVIPTYIQLGNFSSARNMLNQFDHSTYENHQFYVLFDVLTSIGESERSLNQIFPSEKSIVQSIANSEAEAAIKAQSVIAELNDSTYVRIPFQLPLNIGNGNSGNNEVKIDMTMALKTTVIYPNPSNGNLIISFDDSSVSTIKLFDMTGKIIQDVIIDKNTFEFKFYNLDAGIYNLTIQFTNGRVENNRIVVK